MSLPAWKKKSFDHFSWCQHANLFQKPVTNTFIIYQLSDFHYSLWTVLILSLPANLSACSVLSVTGPFGGVMVPCLIRTTGYWNCYIHGHSGCRALLSKKYTQTIHLVSHGSKWAEQMFKKCELWRQAARCVRCPFSRSTPCHSF